MNNHPNLNIEGMQKLSHSMTNVINRHHVEIGLSPLEVISVLATIAIQVCGSSTNPEKHLSVLIKTLDSKHSFDQMISISNRKKEERK